MKALYVCLLIVWFASRLCADQLTVEERDKLDSLSPNSGTGRVVKLTNGNVLNNAHFEITKGQAYIVWKTYGIEHRMAATFDLLQLEDIIALCVLDAGRYKASKPVYINDEGIYVAAYPHCDNLSKCATHLVRWSVLGDNVRKTYGW